MATRDDDGAYDAFFWLFLAVMGIVALAQGRSLPMGTAANMGPGYLIRILSLILIVFSVSMLGRSLLRNTTVPRGLLLRPLAAILSGIGAFAVVLPLAGLALACLASVLVGGMAVRPVKWVELGLSAIAGAAVVSFVFVKILLVPVRILPW